MGRQRRRKDLYILEREEFINKELRDVCENNGIKIIEEVDRSITYIETPNRYRYKINNYKFKKDLKLPDLVGRSNPFSIYNIKPLLNEHYPNIELLSTEYIGNNEPLKIMCRKHKNYGVQKTTYSSIQKRTENLCKCCQNEANKDRNITDAETMKKKCDELGLIYCGRDSLNHNGRVHFICPKHKEKGEQVSFWTNFKIAVIGCMYCQNKKRTTEDFKNEVYQLNNTYKIVGSYKNEYTPIECVCNMCGRHWSTEARVLLMGCGCPSCKMSKGELSVKDTLIKMGVEYEREYKYKDCRYKGVLEFDFYLPKYNAIIEYDGEYHYMPIKYSTKPEYDDHENFERAKKVDEIKNNYCKMHGIPLLRIPYWEYENIEMIVMDFIKDIQESQETAG